ncbi:MAG: hydrogenase iron-sulfur subunit [Candidatus Wukongarchaeota archaeon]|nr:hydrogenase iron-sulfur subunit [Candidatus Wukongarchaeota archaeon]
MKVGVFVCHCGFNIASTVDINEVVSELKKDPELLCFDHDYVCSAGGLGLIKEKILEETLERVVVASCTPKLHEFLFRQTLEKAGLNPYFLEVANIREQCSWVHFDDPKRATRKAIVLIKMAVEKVKLQSSLSVRKVPVEQSVLVVGGGVAGITAALNVADAGLKVYLVEREPSIGGHMAQFDKTFPTMDCSICILAPLMVRVYEHQNITLLTNSEVLQVNGSVGKFEVEVLKYPRYVDEEKCSQCYQICTDPCPIEVPNEFDLNMSKRKAIYVPFPQAVPLVPLIDEENCVGCRACELVCDLDAIDFDQKPEKLALKVGAIIVATGYETYDASKKTEYGYGKYQNVITSIELERMLTPFGPTEGNVIRPTDGEYPKNVVFVQCVGSRDEETPYCSRVCCSYAIKQAQEIKERIPGVEVYIFYQDIRTFGKGQEEAFRKALDEYRIRFIRGRVSKIIEDNKSKSLYVLAEDTLVGRPVEVFAGLVVLSVGLQPPKGTDKIASLLKVSRSVEGFLLEAHPKLKPVETHKAGIFLAGCIHGPKDIQDTVSHAGAAASKAISLLIGGEITVEKITPVISLEDCIKCGLCEKACDFGAIIVTKGGAQVNEAACFGCGACAATCPTSAIDMPISKDAQVLAQIDAAIKEKWEFPLIIGFLCNWCGYNAADIAGVGKQKYQPNMLPIRLSCSASVDPSYVFHALFKGADGVLIAGCYPQDCYYSTGFKKAKQRVSIIKSTLNELGISKERVHIISSSASEGKKFAKEVDEFIKKIEKLGIMGTELESEIMSIKVSKEEE